MATYQSEAAKAHQPAVDSASAGEIKAVRGTFALTAALALNDIVELVKLPAGHVPVDCILDTDELDTGADAIVLDVGVIGGDVDALIDGSTVGQAGGLARMDQKTGPRVASSTSETVYGVTVATGPGTGATSGTIGLTLFYRSARYGE